jgi:acyl dehydratase
MELQTGTSIEFISFPQISQPQLNAYAQASGDMNPIHLDEKVAKSMGLPGIIAHGMLSAGFLGERARRAVRESSNYSGFQLSRFQTRFKAMVFLGDNISVGGTVKEATDSKLVLDLQAKNQKDEVVTTATAEFTK